MKESKTVYFIGCGVLGPDINYLGTEHDLKLKKKFLPGGLHSQPDELRRRLQLAIDEVSQDSSCQRIIVGYGLCGQGAVGIQAGDVPLVFPKVHDCIALFLGSDQAYKEQFKKFPGTYYISSGWYAEKTEQEKDKPEQIQIGSHTIDSTEFTETYGEKGRNRIMDFFSSWQNNYQRAAYIDTGSGNVERPAQHAREMAEKYNWQYQKITGSLSLMKQLLTTTVSTEQILVVPPHHVTIHSTIENCLGAAPEDQAGKHEQSGIRRLLFDEAENSGLSIKYGLGIDAGGTYTDAAIYDFHSKTVQGKSKALTTKWDFSLGIEEAISRLDSTVLSQVQLVSVSTTLATNAIVEAEGQNAGLLLMPGSGFDPGDQIPHHPKAIVKGRLNIQGRELEAIDPEEIRLIAKQMISRHGVTSFAVSGYAGSMNPIHELEIKQILQEETDMVVTCGHELSNLLNFVVRAQTAVLNARIIHRMIKFFKELDLVLKKREIHAPVMVVKGDGTLMSSAMAIERPVETILSGPAASVAGAKMLTGLTDATVVDIGGTTTDTADLVDGIVDVCERGARVGGITTHIKALNMQTVGLGGDSLISWQNERITIGPRRVAPLVWADAESEHGINNALAFIESKLQHPSFTKISPVILVAMKGALPFEATDEEKKIYQLLRQRPHALDELAEPLNLLSTRFLSTERLEASGLVQKCGLTPTDLLHITGQFVKWPPDTAIRMVDVFAVLSKQDPKAFIGDVLKKFEKALAKELLKKQLSKDIDIDPEDRLTCHLFDCMLSDKGENYSISATLNNPIIGIGAPAKYFLPDAGAKLNGKVIIPKDADVANALGAISSHIMIKQKVSIIPADIGRFRVEGIKGAKQFKNIDKAEAWAVNQLKIKVQDMARFAGTSRKTVEMEIKDRVVNTANGSSLFLDRSIQATLSGSPDLVLNAALAH